MEELQERFRALEQRLQEAEAQTQRVRQEAQHHIAALRQENEQLRHQAPAVPVVPAPAPVPAPAAVAPAAYRVRPPAPPRFAHPTRQQTTYEWLFQVEMHFLAIGLLDLAMRIGFVATLLDGAASSWWSLRFGDIQAGRAPDFASWEEFKRTMCEYFHPTGLEVTARLELRRLQQTGRVQAYARIFQRLVTQIPTMDQGTIVDTFTHGLKDATRAFVRQRRPANLLAAIEAAETFELSTAEDYHGPPPGRADRPEPMDLGQLSLEEREGPPSTEEEDPPRLHALSPRRPNRPPDRHPSRSPDRNRRVSFGRSPTPRPGGRTPSPYRRTGDQPKCWECGRFGHFARDCPRGKGPEGAHAQSN